MNRLYMAGSIIALAYATSFAGASITISVGENHRCHNHCRHNRPVVHRKVEWKWFSGRGDRWVLKHREIRFDASWDVIDYGPWHIEFMGSTCYYTHGRWHHHPRGHCGCYKHPHVRRSCGSCNHRRGRNRNIECEVRVEVKQNHRHNRHGHCHHNQHRGNCHDYRRNSHHRNTPAHRNHEQKPVRRPSIRRLHKSGSTTRIASGDRGSDNGAIHRVSIRKVGIR